MKARIALVLLMVIGVTVGASPAPASTGELGATKTIVGVAGSNRHGDRPDEPVVTTCQ